MLPTRPVRSFGIHWQIAKMMGRMLSRKGCVCLVIERNKNVGNRHIRSTLRGMYDEVVGRDGEDDYAFLAKCQLLRRENPNAFRSVGNSLCLHSD